MADSAKFRARSGWSASAKRTFRDVIAAHSDLDSAKLTGLYGACDLLSEADKMQLVVDDEGRVVAGSQGQPVAHPLIAEVRQYRRTALDTLRALGLDGRSATSSAASALANKRWGGRKAPVTPITRPA